MRHLMIFLLVVCSFQPVVAAAQTAEVHTAAKPQKAKARVFRSFKKLAAKFGAESVASLKDFDFKTKVLIWEVADLTDDAQPEVADVALPPEAQEETRIRVTVSAAKELEGVRTAKKFEIFVMSSNPCMGGARKSDEQSLDCRATITASMEAGRKRLVLFATPRKDLQDVVVTRVVMQPRPAARPSLGQ